MVDRKHKCLPRLSFFSPSLSVQHSNINWVRGTIPPSVRDRSHSVSHSSTAETPAGLRTCAHNRTTYSDTHTHMPGGFSDLPETWSWLLSTISLNGGAQWTTSPAERRRVIGSVKFTANGGNAVVYHRADISRRSKSPSGLKRFQAAFRTNNIYVHIRHFNTY